MRSLEIKAWAKLLCFLCVLCACVANALSLDREAFSITNYDLNLRIEPEQHRLGARGKITLRNDTSSPQKIVVLQISSSLDWRSIKDGGKLLQYVTQPYASDIDHTGGLSEAVVTLPKAIEPHGAFELEIAYEGVILLDATRLTRIGTPDDVAASADWDQIDPSFTAVRGAGYVAWYPITTEVANLSEEFELQDVLGRWKTREAESQMTVRFDSTEKATILFSGTPDGFVVQHEEGIATIGVFTAIHLGANAPTFALANFKKLDVKGVSAIHFLPGKDAVAASYADVLGSLDPLPGARGGIGLQVAQLADSNATSFVSGNLLLMPFQPLTDENRLTLVYGLAKQRAASPHPWINDGLAHFAQVLDIERQHGRKAALEYLTAHMPLLVDSEKQIPSTQAPSSDASGNTAAARSLINTSDEIYLQSKSMWVWSMLRDMVGDVGMNLMLFQYSAPEDKSATYMQKLLEKASPRDLEWFLDDWVYRDRGLPDFKVESAFARSTLTKSFILTVTVDNLGGAGAEVPVIVKFAGGEVVKRMEVRAKSRATIRVETPAPPQEIVVNDGSVPESDITNNSFKVEAPKE